MRLIDGDVRIGIPARVRIGDGDAAEPLPCLSGNSGLMRGVVIQRRRRVGVAVRPSIDGDRSDVAVEIETPAKQLVTLDNQMSAYVTHAGAQVTEYRRFLERPPAAQTHFPNLDQVTCVAVVGLEGGLTAEQQQALRNYNREHYGLQLVGFDWLARRGRAMRENMIRTGVAVRQHTRIA